MYELVRYGGFPIWMTLVLGIGGLVLAALTVWRPTPERVGVCESAVRAVLYTNIAGFAAGLSNMLAAAHLAATNPEFKDNVNFATQIVFEGTSEALSIPILGFAMAGSIAVLTTVARMRTSTP